MSANRVKHEFRTAINFDGSRVSKYKVGRLIREAEFPFIEYRGAETLVFDHEIKIGHYVIRLLLNTVSFKSSIPNKLNQYGGFGIRMYQEQNGQLKEIWLNKSNFFREESWICRNENSMLNISDLVSIILLCNRLDRLKAFN